MQSGWADGLRNHTKCFVFVARYSRSFLDLMVDEYVDQGSWAQGEWFASTVCAHGSELGSEEPCTMGDLAEVPQLLATGCFDWRKSGGCPLLNVTAPRQTRWRYNESAAPMLFHPLKW